MEFSDTEILTIEVGKCMAKHFNLRLRDQIISMQMMHILSYEISTAILLI